MIAWLWLRAHRWPTLLATSCAVAVVGVVFGGDHVPIPSLSSARQMSVPLGQLLPLILACAIGSHSRQPTSLFRVTPRLPYVHRAAVAGVLLITAAAATLLVPNMMTALRNTLGLTGMALVTAVAVGATRSWTLPLFYLMCCLLFGTRIRATANGESGPQWWAFAIADQSDRTATTLAILVCLLGLVLFVIFGAKEEAAVRE
ncbi:hypothetical protein ABZ816_37085 [Actinosynnema sp. NPDC047251]|uniref:hypothetical protein n=1 Tax=Saccharothrix espanaensis TaxID=103731 RepID=UPI0011DD33DC|nr:hypothetical protein [Saccharothrix espanaensis]